MVEKEKKSLVVTAYAICKNESQFLELWLSSMSEADHICLLDTGSTDGTFEAAKKHKGVIVRQKIIDPWRFDVARNESLKLIPEDTDVCVCVDLDERFEKGWRKKLEKAWKPSATTGRYEYVWSFNADGSDGHKFLGEKIHKYGMVEWKHPVHEILTYKGKRVECQLPIRLEHHPDASKSRSTYLPLLELAVSENPDDDRDMHYLGREYMFHGMWSRAIETLKRHLELPSATWKAERASSMRFIARCYKQLGDPTQQELWLMRAAIEAPEQRESLLDLAQLCYDQQRWHDLVTWAQKALDITERNLTYLTEPESWGMRPHDLLSLGLWYTGNKEAALREAKIALEMEPENERLKKNVELMEG